MSDFPISNARTRVRPTMMALAVAIIAVLVWIIVVAIQHKLPADVTSANLGVQLGQTLVIEIAAAAVGALIIWSALFFLIVRPVAPARGRVHLAILLVVAVVIMAPTSAFKVLGAAMSGEDDALRAVSLASLERADASVKKFSEERERIISGGFLEPHALAQPGGLARGGRKVAELRDLLDRSVAEMERLKAAAHADIRALPMSEARRKAALSDFDHGYETSLAEGQDSIDLAYTMLDEMDAMLAVLARAPRAWQIDGGSLAFSRQADLDDYNRHVIRVQEIDRELQVRKQARARQLADTNPFDAR